MSPLRGDAKGSLLRTALLLFGLALAVRLFGLDWDQGHFYHPDERAIAEAGTRITWKPLQLNPHFFPYGSLPIYVTRAVSLASSTVKPWLKSYDGIVAVGRAMSAVWGALTVLALLFLGRRLYGPRVGFWAALFLALSVFHVQNSHFGTSDIPLTFLILVSLAFIVRIVEEGKPLFYVAAGLSIGFAAATKISALPVLLPLGLAALYRLHLERRARPVLMGVVAVAAVGAGFFLGEPYAILDYRAFSHDILEQSRMVRNAGSLPYTNQYVGTLPFLYPLGELIFWGMGPLLALAGLAGTALVVRGTRRAEEPLPKERRAAELILLAWVVVFFAITGSFSVKFPRYLLPLYPLLALWAARLLVSWADRSRAGRVARGAVVGATAAYLVAFLAIYTRPHTAVQASEWLYENVPPKSKVLTQHWDEGFPFQFPNRNPSQLYRLFDFPYYDEDDTKKIDRLAGELATSDYVVFQTKRLYGAITRVPEKYPLTNSYFYSFFAGDLGYELIKDVRSRPRLWLLEFPSELADESFSVYDHPKVLIFRNKGRLTAEAIRAKILSGLPSRRLSRRQILLTTAGAQPAGASPAPGMPGRVSSSLLATLLVVLLLAGLGKATACLLPASPRPGLYALSKVIGVLGFCYVPWLLTSLGIASFTQGWILLLAALVFGGALLAARNRPLPDFPRAEVRQTEILFYAAFFLFLGLRFWRPEITWGEKPMDFAFLNALYRTVSLPPPEPWFSGSPLHYTYFGHFVMATLGKALSIQPSLMFNLGIAVIGALTAAALYAAGTLLTGRRSAGVLAVVLTLFAGNLAGLRSYRRLQHWDWHTFWDSSRVVKNTVNEFPLWSLIFADLHAHVLALPFSVAFVASLILFIRRRDDPTRHASSGALLLALLATLFGTIITTNGWSLPTYVCLTLFLLGIAWLRRERPPGAGLKEAVTSAGTTVLGPAVVIVGGGFLAFQPFFASFLPPRRQFGREVGPWAPPGDVAAMFGLFLVLLVPFVFILLRRALAREDGALSAPKKVALAVAVAGLGLSVLDLKALFSRHPFLTQARSAWPFTALLFILAFVAAVHRRTPERFRMPAALASFSFAVITGCEFVFVWDRMNTLFKFYYDSWLFLGIASAAVFLSLFSEELGAPIGRIAWRFGVFCALLLSAFTVALAVTCGPRLPYIQPTPFTLDGTAYLRKTLPYEAAAITWLNRNIPGIPVLCEGQGPSYQEYSRVCMNTGLPLVLGWEYHVTQRGHSEAEVASRKRDEMAIYRGDRAVVEEAFKRLHVALVYVGENEKRLHGNANRERFLKWADLMTPVYQNKNVDIFAVHGGFRGALPQQKIEAVAVGVADVSEAAPRQELPGQVTQPRGIAFDSQGNLYVADFGNDRIQKFDSAFEPLLAWGRKGKEHGEFVQPSDVAIGPRDEVFVADMWNSRIQVFDAQGTFLREMTSDFFGPRGVAVDAAGASYVSDTGNNRIVKFSAAGSKEAVWGKAGKGAGELAEPVGIAVDKDGTVVVCDNGNGRLQLFDKEGRSLKTIPVPGFGRGVFSEPHVAIDADGLLWVTVPDRREVRAYKRDGALVKTIHTDDFAPNVFEKPMGIALRPGLPPVISDVENRVLSLERPTGSAPAPPSIEPATPNRRPRPVPTEPM